MKLKEKKAAGRHELGKARNRLYDLGLRHHHTSTANGYIRVGTVIEDVYSGYFGDGRVLKYNLGGITGSRHNVEYWIWREER